MFLPCSMAIASLALPVASIGLFGQAATAEAQTGSSLGREVRAPDLETSVLVVLEGFVLDADGAPAEGTVVVSSTGGRAVVDRRGRYRLEAPVPRDAASVELVAFGSGGGAKASVALAPAIRTTRVDPLLLSGGAACEPGWLPTFTGFTGLGTTEAFAIYDDGRGPALYIAGLGGIVRWDGSSSESHGVGGGPDATVLALQVHDDGGGPALYAGGWFTTVDGVPANRIAKWNGSSWSALGSGASSHVRALAVYDDGSGPALFAGGSFTSAGGMPASRIAKWNGSVWAALGSGTNSGVLALAVHDDGSGPALFVGGNFTIAGGVSGFSRIARWNGSSWSKLGSGVNGPVFALTVFDDGGGPALYLGGNFFEAGAVDVPYVAKWSGSSWAALGAGLGEPVEALAAYDDGGGPALYAGGKLSKWDGSSWTQLGSGSGVHVGALMAHDDGDEPVLLAGTGVFADGVVVHGIAKWDGSSFGPLIPPGKALNGRVETMAVFDDGSGPALYASGLFTTAGDVGARIARWDGSSWSLGAAGPNGPVHELMEFDDGSGPRLVAGGLFSTEGGGPANYIAKWDGSSWAPLGGGLQRAPYTLASHDDGSGPGLVASVAFNLPGEYFDRIMRWDGSSWTQLGGDFPRVVPYHNSTNVYDMTAFDDGSGPSLYVGGLFTSAGGVAASHIARWDGSGWAPLASGTNGIVWTLIVFDDGSGPALYVSGDFTDAGGVSAPNGIAKWDGAGWSALASEPGSPLGAVTVWNDGSGPALYASVGYTTPEGWWADLARWDGSVWTPYSAGSIDGSIWVMTGFDDGERSMLHVGGQFVNTFTGEAYLSRWGCPLASIQRKTRAR